MKLKVKVQEVDIEYLKKVKAESIAKAKEYYEAMPFVTKVYLTMKLRMPYSFISDNWKEITGNDFE